MNEKIKEDILAVLDKVINILAVKEEKNVVGIKGLSNHTIHNASIFQDRDSVGLAVIVYSLSKIIERKGELSPDILDSLNKARKELKENNFSSYRKTIKDLLKEISRIDNRLKLFIEQVIKQAEIKKGSKLYEHGISLAQAAEVLGISQWELMNYIGKTRIADMAIAGEGIKARLNFARGLFGL